MGWAEVLRNDEAFHHDYEDALDTGLVLKDCVTIAFAFKSFSLCWICRDANKIVHVLERGVLLRANYMDCTFVLLLFVRGAKFGCIRGLEL
ncbi:hypothetical protein Goarm_013181, partial [Gossypium armourianum]|nr:hypothetical protein [Gossypium armourianum]